MECQCPDVKLDEIDDEIIIPLVDVMDVGTVDLTEVLKDFNNQEVAITIKLVEEIEK